MRYEITRPSSSRKLFNTLLSDKLFNDLYSNTDDSSNTWHPAVDITEKNDQYLLKADLPGMTREEIQVELVSGMLTIRGDRKEEESNDESDYCSTERCVGQFSRSFTVNDVDEKSIKAEYVNGVLTVHLPKSEEKKARKISIN